MIIHYDIIILDFTQDTIDIIDTNEDNNVTINVVKIKNKWQTSITGLIAEMDPSVKTDKDLLKKLKKKLSCNGYLTGDRLTFQGDHKGTIYQYLLSIGITSDRIKDSGTGK